MAMTPGNKRADLRAEPDYRTPQSAITIVTCEVNASVLKVISSLRAGTPWLNFLIVLRTQNWVHRPAIRQFLLPPAFLTPDPRPPTPGNRGFTLTVDGDLEDRHGLILVFRRRVGSHGCGEKATGQ